MAKLSEEINLSQWNIIEQPIDDHSMLVLTSLIKLGNNEITSIETIHNMLGDEIYKYIKELLNDTNIKIDTKKEKPKKLSKADIIKNNFYDKLTTKIIQYKNNNYADILNSEILEFKGIGLIKIAENICKNEVINMERIYSLIIILQKFIYNTQLLKGTNSITKEDIHISETLIKDIEYWLNILLFKYTNNKFDGLLICSHYPKLLIYTEFDAAIPSSIIKPKKHQEELFSVFKNNFDNGSLIIYRATIGSGKTTSIISIAQYVSNLRKDNINKKVLFVCNLDSVKLQVSNLAYHAKIKFAIATFTNNETKIERNIFAMENNVDNKIRIQRHYSCNTDDEICLIITCPEIACQLLTGINSDEYILYFDEPTIGADDINSKQLYDNMHLMYLLSKNSIVSSATFPSIEDIDNIINNYTNKYPLGNIITINTNNIDISCNIIDFNGNKIVPHYNCASIDELKQRLHHIHTCPFLGRVYSIDVLRQLFLQIQQPNDFFNNANNLTTTNIKDKCLEYLKHINEDSLHLFQYIPLSNNDNSIHLTEITTKQAYKFTFQTLIITEDPIGFIKTHLLHIYNNEIITFKSNYKQYLINIEKYNAKCKELQPNIKTTYSDIDETKTNINKTKHKEFNKMSKLENDKVDNTHNKEYQKLLENPPKLIFDDKLKINTRLHLEFYNNTSSFIRENYPNEEILKNDISESEELIFLLLCGIGIYYPDLLSKSYTNCVLDLANKGKLVFLIANHSISYGTNYPINRVIIMKDYAQKHSINTLYQVMGRAGRVGKSWFAEIIIDDSDEIETNKISYRILHEHINSEAINMINVFTKIANNYYEQTLIECQQIVNSYIELYNKEYELYLKK